jgi:hypothetical protein
MEIQRKSTPLLLQGLVETLPFLPSYASLNWVASGISPPSIEDGSQVSRYLDACGRKRIIPFSTVALVYKDECRGSGILVPVPSVLDVEPAITLDSLISGGRYHQIKFSSAIGDLGARQFVQFRERWMRKIVNEGYELLNGDFYFTDFKFLDQTAGPPYLDDSGNTIAHLILEKDKFYLDVNSPKANRDAESWIKRLNNFAA